jgi:hypothetical protein
MALLLQKGGACIGFFIHYFNKKYKRENSSFDMGIVNEDNEKDIILDFETKEGIRFAQYTVRFL